MGEMKPTTAEDIAAGIIESNATNNGAIELEAAADKREVFMDSVAARVLQRVGISPSSLDATHQLVQEAARVAAGLSYDELTGNASQQILEEGEN